jgi:hypothetical protein
MATSEFEGFIKFGNPSNGPVGVGARAALTPVISRDFALNNVSHAADQIAKPISNWSTCLSRDPLLQQTDFYSTWQRICSTGPFKANVRSDFTSYVIRFQVVASVEIPLDLVKLRVVVAPPSILNQVANLEIPGDGAIDAIWQSTSTVPETPGIITGSSQGIQGWSNLIKYDFAGSSYASVLPQGYIFPNGTPAASETYELEVGVFSGDKTSQLAVHALYCSEYIGL